ncbi:MAG: hypothetical protein JOY61_18595 [Chloroflexi bacterium]|nr:hypothetical protein [Chloroflexota bacterium]
MRSTTRPHVAVALNMLLTSALTSWQVRVKQIARSRLDATRVQRHHVRRLEQLGYTVTLTPIAV